MEDLKVKTEERQTTEKKAEKTEFPLPKKFIILGAIAIVSIICSVFWNKNQVFRDIFTSMDTTVTLRVWGDKNNDYKKLAEKLDGLFDCYDKKSEIHKLNSKGEAKLSKETADILKKSKELWEKYPECDITAGGLIDLWKVKDGGNIPTDEEIQAELLKIGGENLTVSKNKATLSQGKINLGSVAKGYACDVFIKEFDKNEEKCAIISFGSSSLMYGEKPDGEKFKVGVNNPLDKGENLGTLALDECFVSTSGAYESFFEKDGKKYGHIMDLTTGKPVESDLLSVTVIGQSGIETDFLSTLIYIRGTAGLDEFFEMDDISIVAVCENKEVYISKSLEEKFTLFDAGFKVTFR